MQERRLVAIMPTLAIARADRPVRRSFSEGGPARRNKSEGGFTDIDGYTSLIGSDEDRAFEVLRKNRQILQIFTS